jgi:serine/threonine protein kinase
MIHKYWVLWLQRCQVEESLLLKWLCQLLLALDYLQSKGVLHR